VTDMAGEPPVGHVPYNVEVGMSDTDELIAFLRDRLDDEERRITGSGDLGWLTYRRPDGSIAYTIPAALAEDGTWIAVGAVARDFTEAVVVHRESERLAEVNATRKTLDRYESILRPLPADADSVVVGRFTVLMNEYDLRILPSLALPYAAHPDFRDEWRAAT
jgi:hypothetical protein